jgi:hypothetical protein
MGILRNREELLPVTCAVLSAEDRNAFFAAVKKKTKGRVEKIAEIGGTVKSIVSDWMSGKAGIPYHTLQRLSNEFGVDMPPVSELRREFQAVLETRPSKPSRPGAKSARPAAKPAGDRKAPVRDKERKAAEPKREGRASGEKKSSRSEKRKRPERKQPERRPERKPAAAAQSGPRAPKLSDKAAYWTGVVLAAGRREKDSIVLTADRRVGQNYALVWTKLCEDLFGIKPSVRLSEDRKSQEAILPLEGISEFVDRIEIKEGQPAPGAPRWAWSNPDWKLAFLRGVIDASAVFRRDPALELLGLSERLVLSVKKLLGAHKLEIKPEQGEGDVGEPAIILEGRDQVKRYFDEIGADNHKLRDQLRAFFKEGRGSETSRKEAAGDSNGARKTKKKRGRRGGRGRSRARSRGPRRRIPGEEAPGESAAAELAAEADPGAAGESQ